MESNTFCFNTEDNILKNTILHNFAEMLRDKHISDAGVIVSENTVMFVRDKMESEPLTVRMISFNLNHYGKEITAKHNFDGGLFTDAECDTMIAFLLQHVKKCGEPLAGGARNARNTRNTRNTRNARNTRNIRSTRNTRSRRNARSRCNARKN